MSELASVRSTGRGCQQLDDGADPWRIESLEAGRAGEELELDADAVAAVGITAVGIGRAAEDVADDVVSGAARERDGSRDAMAGRSVVPVVGGDPLGIADRRQVEAVGRAGGRDVGSRAWRSPVVASWVNGSRGDCWAAGSNTPTPSRLNTGSTLTTQIWFRPCGFGYDALSPDGVGSLLWKRDGSLAGRT